MGIRLRYMSWYEYYDIDTGEEVQKDIFNKFYYEVKRESYATINRKHSIKHFRYTIIGRRKPEQGTLFGSDNKPKAGRKPF